MGSLYLSLLKKRAVRSFEVTLLYVGHWVSKEVSILVEWNENKTTFQWSSEKQVVG
jgi:hypothetical protein